MSNIFEIAPDVYRLSIHVPEINLGFNHFLVKDDEPLLFHTGSRAMFPALREMVAKVIDPAKLRWISFSHFETDEWLKLIQRILSIAAALPGSRHAESG